MKPMIGAISAAVLLAATPAVIPAWAQQHRSNDQDRRFVDKAAVGGEEEVAAGKLAESQGGDPGVRMFGRWMATDHTMMNDMLQEHAKQAGIEVPSGERSGGDLDKLKSLHDRQFDRQYVPAQVKDHEETIALCREEASAGENPELKRLAQHALPILEAHLTAAKDLEARLGAAASAGSQTSLPRAAPPATTHNATTSTNQSPDVKAMNQQGKKQIETEGK
jgi:putative membrane protein